ncbi:hypothetical protein AURDEDRAFT_115592 [Auricularia subglabra TFB-10046 SS5]|nr:hypothetical protein AURDEDRAFT_115592 [Auricularia subglabra TFB-10046 SS5]
MVGNQLEGDRAVTPASRPFTPVYIPPDFKAGLSTYYDGAFNPRSPHRRRRGTLPPQGGLWVDTGVSRDRHASESRPLTPVPIPPNFEHDIQEYYRASMQPHSPESCRRRAEHRERAATARERESSASEWPSSPETPPLEDDASTDPSDDPIEVIEGVLKVECEKLYVTLSRRGSIATAAVAEQSTSSGPPLNAAKAAAFGDYVQETKARKTAKDRNAMCSRWLAGLEPIFRPPA